MNFGSGLIRLLTGPFAMSAHRIVLGVAERMPDLGREFYERGPMLGARNLAAFLDQRVAKGELAIQDTALAAAQFVDLSQSTLMRPRLFNAERMPPSEDEIAYVVGEAVATFMARYGVTAKGA
jgi:hypothetical protein